MNTLYYGDNLKILRDYIRDESVDLICRDPHTGGNTSRGPRDGIPSGLVAVRECVSSPSYNVLFKDESGTEADSQIPAFEDTWHWNQKAEETYPELINQPDDVGRMIECSPRFG